MANNIQLVKHKENEKKRMSNNIGFGVTTEVS